MKSVFVLALALLPLMANAAPVHITLNASAVVQPDASDFFTLGSVAALSGGDAALRARLAAVSVGRAPLPGDVRHLTPGDLDLKLRQAGYEPGRDAVVGGAGQSDVTVSSASEAVPVPPPTAAEVSPAGPGTVAAATNAPVIHPGNPVTIRIDEGDIRITAAGVAETAGAVGATVRVYRTGSSTELNGIVLDAQTVELEP